MSTGDGRTRTVEQPTLLGQLLWKGKGCGLKGEQKGKHDFSGDVIKLYPNFVVSPQRIEDVMNGEHSESLANPIVLFASRRS